jgi:hypothetical protein
VKSRRGESRQDGAVSCRDVPVTAASALQAEAEAVQAGVALMAGRRGPSKRPSDRGTLSRAENQKESLLPQSQSLSSSTENEPLYNGKVSFSGEEGDTRDVPRRWGVSNHI